MTGQRKPTGLALPMHLYYTHIIILVQIIIVGPRFVCVETPMVAVGRISMSLRWFCALEVGFTALGSGAVASARPIEHGGRTASRSDRSSSDEALGSHALAPRSSLRDEIRAGVARSPHWQASGLVKNTLYLLVGIAATGWFAAFVQETQVNRPLRDSNAQAPMPDHENLTGVWLHPVLCEALKDKNNINILSNGDKLGEFLAARGLSFSGPTPIMRIETTSTFDDPNVQAKFGMRYSYLERDPDNLVNILSSLGGVEDKTSFIPNLRDVPLHKMDMSNLPEPMDAGAVLDLVYRRQEFGVPRPHSWPERTERDAAAQRDDPQGPGWGHCAVR